MSGSGTAYWPAIQFSQFFMCCLLVNSFSLVRQSMHSTTTRAALIVFHSVPSSARTHFLTIVLVSLSIVIVLLIVVLFPSLPGRAAPCGHRCSFKADGLFSPWLINIPEEENLFLIYSHHP